MRFRVFNVLLSILLILIWCGIFFASFIFLMVSDIMQHFGNGILKYIFAFIYALAFVVPIIFRKRLKAHCPYPLMLIIFTVLSVIVNSGIYLGITGYLSDYSRKKWDRYENFRIYMIDDLQKEHQLIGKSEEEIIELLGEPARKPDSGPRRFEYYVGDSMIDPYVYEIIFNNGIVENTMVVEH